jgi:NADH-quinone oxidoreductase subunit N
MTLTDLLKQSHGILPELLLSLAICTVIFADMASRLRHSRNVSGFVALAGVAAALAVVAARLFSENLSPGSPTFGGMVRQDQIAVFFKIVFFLSTIAVILFSLRSREIQGCRAGEYFALLLGAVLGACFLVSADNLILFVLGLETLSICCYVLAGFLKHERASAEASLKYMIYGAVASGVLFFGLSYLYGMSGTLSISEGCGFLSKLAATGHVAHLPIILVLVLILAGIGFKIAMVPFHFWCPDVYQGSPTPITAFLSVVSKAAGFGALLRILLPFFSEVLPAGADGRLLSQQDLPILFGVLSVITMTFGNLVAIRQTDVKRLLAYSSIAHAGYLLMGLTVYNSAAIEAILFYFFVYMIMNLGAFWIVIVMVNRVGSAEISRFNGIAFKAPFLFSALFIFLISLTGLPPTAGFVGKFMLFKVVVGAGLSNMNAAGHITPMTAFYLLLALIGVLNSAVSLYYYMRIARAMAFEKAADDRPLGDDPLDRAYAAAFMVPAVALIYFAPILQLIALAGL